MNGNNRFSDEFLNAFVDDQLAPEEKSRAYPVIAEDEALNQRVCELRKMRDLVQLAYKDPPAPPRRGERTTLRGAGSAIAAGLMLAVGITLGWLLHQPSNAESGKAATPQNTTASSTETKVLFHLSSGNVERMREVLDEAEGLLQLYRDTNRNARIEIVANGAGLDLLRADVSPFRQRIEQLKQHYPNLTFAACQNTIDRLRHDQGIVAHLVPQAEVVDSGIAQIIRLQRQGWAYIQV